MSRSINELLKKLSTNEQIPVKETDLVNPQIPEFDDTINYKDEYHLAMKTYSEPRNGMTVLTNNVSRHINQNQYSKEKASFLMEGSIDPNLIRSKVDPDSAHPSLSSQSLFSFMPDSVKKPTNSSSLIALSHASELNWKNRFTPKPAT